MLAPSSSSIFGGAILVAPKLEGAKSTELAKVRLPVLVITGSKDVEGLDTAKTLAAIPQSQQMTIEGASHACYLDNPQTFNKMVVEFMMQR